MEPRDDAGKESDVRPLSFSGGGGAGLPLGLSLVRVPPSSAATLVGLGSGLFNCRRERDDLSS